MVDVKKAREAKGIGQNALANETGVTQQYIWLIENGQRRPSVEVAKKIANVLGFDWTEFFK